MPSGIKKSGEVRGDPGPHYYSTVKFSLTFCQYDLPHRAVVRIQYTSKLCALPLNFMKEGLDKNLMNTKTV